MWDLLSLQMSIWFHWESSLTSILLRQLLISFFSPVRKHHVLTLITNPMIWPFFRLCSLPVSLPVEVLKIIWKWNTCSSQNIPFPLLLSFVLITLWCLYWRQRGEKVKGCLFISIFLLGKGTEKAKCWLPGHHLVCEDAISNVCFVAGPNSFAEPPHFWWQEFCGSDRCW